jgi:hypothetical protein
LSIRLPAQFDFVVVVVVVKSPAMSPLRVRTEGFSATLGLETSIDHCRVDKSGVGIIWDERRKSVYIFFDNSPITEGLPCVDFGPSISGEATIVNKDHPDNPVKINYFPRPRRI